MALHELNQSKQRYRAEHAQGKERKDEWMDEWMNGWMAAFR